MEELAEVAWISEDHRITLNCHEKFLPKSSQVQTSSCTILVLEMFGVLTSRLQPNYSTFISFTIRLCYYPWGSNQFDVPLLLVYSQFNRMNYDEHKRMNDSGNKASQNMIDCWQFNNECMIFGKHSIWITRIKCSAIILMLQKAWIPVRIRSNQWFGFFLNFLVVFFGKKKTIDSEPEQIIWKFSNIILQIWANWDWPDLWSIWTSNESSCCGIFIQ